MSSPRVSRRTVTTGAAWAVPVIAVGAAAPAMAASPGDCPTVTLVGYTRSGGGSNPTWTINVTVTGLTPGVSYLLQLNVTDSKGASSTPSQPVTTTTPQPLTFTAVRHDNGQNASISTIQAEFLAPFTCLSPVAI